MRKLIIGLILTLCSATGYSQVLDPVVWKYEAKMLTKGSYEIHMTARIEKGWHIYSQSTPKGGPVATTVVFKDNPFAITTGGVLENGTLVKKHEKAFGIDVHYYEGQLELIQVIKLKTPVKTNLSGNIEFMACTDEQCLPPKKVNFSIPIK